MKISCLPVSLFDDICSGKMDLIQWAYAAKEIGYDGIDISIMFLKNRTQTYLQALKNALRTVDIPVVMLTTYPDFTHPDSWQREREFLYLQGDVALCSELNIQYLRILAGQTHPEIPLETRINWVDFYFHRIDFCAQQFGVNLLFENHGKPGAWDSMDFTYNPQNFLKICDRIRDTKIRVNFDTGNITAFGKNPMDILPDVLDMVETIHVTDMAQEGFFSPTVIGTGKTPNFEVFHYLKANGFNRWLCVEEASGNGLDGIQAAYHYIKKLWEEA